MTTPGELKLLQAVEVLELLAEQILAAGCNTEEDQCECERLLEEVRADRQAFVKELPK